jgi:MFS family permease
MKQRHPWIVVLGAVIGLTAGNGPIMQFTFGVFLKPVSAEFGWNRGTMSATLLAGLMLTAVCVPIAGHLVDRFGIRRVILPGIVLFAALTAALGVLAHSPMAFAVLFLLMGIAASTQTPLAYTKAVAGRFDRQRGLALGIASAGVGLGTALMPQLAQYLLTAFSWRVAYVGLGIAIAALALPAVYFLVTSDARTPIAGATDHLPGLTARQALRSGRFWVIAITFFIVAGTANGAIAHAVPLLTDRGMTPQLATTALAYVGLALIGGRVIAGLMVDRWHGPLVAALFFVVPAVGMLAVLATLSPTWAPLAVGLIGLGLGAEVDLSAFLLSRYIGLRSFGEVYGYLFGIFMVGASSGPFVMGVVFDRAGSYTPCLLTFVALLFAAAVLVLTLGPYAFPPARAAVEPPAGASPNSVSALR